MPEDDLEAANSAFQMAAQPDVEPDVIPVTRPREEPARSKIVSAPINKLLPQSSDAEKGVLSSFFLSPKECGSIFVQRRTKPDVFHIPAHATIFGVMLELWNGGEPIDFITVGQRLKKMGELDRVGGAPFISALFSYLPTAANLMAYLEIVEDKAKKRRVIHACTQSAARAWEDQDDAETIIEETEREVMSIRRVDDRGGMSAKEVAALGVNEIQRLIDLGGNIGGFSTGFGQLDRITDGLNGSKVIGVCGHSGTGKSSLAMQILEHLSMDLQIPTAVWPLEMGITQMGKRQILSRAYVNAVNWRNGAMPNTREQESIANAAADFARAKMFFQPKSDCTIQAIRTNARHLVANKGVKVVLVDSMSVLHSESRQAKDNRAREVSECAEGFKDMANELGLCVMVIVHIDRLQKRNERPQRWHVAESAGVERAFDDLWMLYEPDFDEHAEKPDLCPKIGLFIPKQRDGEERVETFFQFHKPYTRFQEIVNKDTEQRELL